MITLSWTLLNRDDFCEQVFFAVGDTIPFVGAQLGVIVAETWAQARAAARKVEQTYSAAAAVTTPDAARAQGLVTPWLHAQPMSGDKEACARLANKFRMTHHHNTTIEAPSGPALVAEGGGSLQGEFATCAQSHMYLETQTAYVAPVEGTKYRHRYGHRHVLRPETDTGPHYYWCIDCDILPLDHTVTY